MKKSIETERMLYQETHDEALALIEKGLDTKEVLHFLATETDNIRADDAVSSILVVGKTGCLHNGASPKLPEDYLKAIDGIKPNPTVGTCAAAVATRSLVITLDFQDDAKWAELRHLPLSLGFKSAFSVPILSMDGKVLGTFGTYFRTKRLPTIEEIEGAKLLAEAAAVSLDPGGRQPSASAAKGMVRNHPEKKR